ncbi:hypothetical protein [Fundidesulfovibrio soli]|uniref:hypothetical protein n=1 Tax=Fundidesulfovibrio soli TaxID=2922716 RepID=UPI001FB00C2C|nr:hypothetical protein [Fundidesulfovibrio soli]
MEERDWELVGEIRLGGDLSFEEAGEVEGRLRTCIEACLVAYGPAYLDFRHNGDDLVFVSSVGRFGPAEAALFCNAVRAEMDPGGKGRLVACGSGFGPIVVRGFSRWGLEVVDALEGGGSQE